jgi:hypothetical protein
MRTIFTPMAMVALFGNGLGRSTLILLLALLSVSVGYLWRRFGDRKPRIAPPGA